MMPESTLGGEEEEKRGFMMIPFPCNQLAGICAGIAYYFGLPTKIIRALMAALMLCGAGIILYIVLWRKMAKREKVPGDFWSVTGDERMVFGKIEGDSLAFR